jgi:hypothetical protein
VRSEVLSDMNTKRPMFWDVSACGLFVVINLKRDALSPSSRNGFSGLMNRFVGQLPDSSSLQKVAGTITHKIFNTSTIRCSL